MDWSLASDSSISVIGLQEEKDNGMTARKLIGKPLNPEQVRKVMVVLSSEENSDCENPYRTFPGKDLTSS